MNKAETRAEIVDSALKAMGWGSIKLASLTASHYTQVWFQSNSANLMVPNWLKSLAHRCRLLLDRGLGSFCSYCFNISKDELAWAYRGIASILDDL